MNKKSFHKIPMASAVSILMAAGAQPIWAQESSEKALEEVVVEGSLGSLPGEDVEVFGFGKSLLETPRSASTISLEQLERFNVSDIDELVAFAPGTFTQSFFGVAGSLDVRGTPGETYFRGVKRLDNPGNYPTPIGASDRVDIVRGPASPIFGPAKIGGYLNFNPKSARADGGQYLESVVGAVSYTTGSWDKEVFTAEVGGPIAEKVGYYLYAELEDSGSYYDNTATEQTIFQASFDSDVTDNLRLQWGGMYHDYTGNQVAGWNRLTQDLIDNGTYITGSPTSLDSNGDGVISHQEYFDAPVNLFFPDGPSSVTEEGLNPFIGLDPDTVGTTQLDGSDVLVAEGDALENEVITLYFDAIYTTDSGLEIKNQLFYEAYDNLNENAYGFSQFHDSSVIEDKIVISTQFESSGLTTSLQASPSVRYTEFEHADDFTNEYFDRRDLSGPSTSLDRRLLATQIDDDYTEYYEGSYLDLGLAFLADFSFDSGFTAIIGARYDVIDIESSIPVDQVLLNNATSGFITVSEDGENLLFFDGSVTAPVEAEDEDEGFSWTVSLSYDSPIGLIPYVTLSEQTTVIAGQGAEITTANIANGDAISGSDLLELGLKGSYFDDSLYFALSYYEQERTDFSAQNTITNNTTLTEGVEAEVRWVPTDSLVLTFGYTNLTVTNLTAKDAGSQFGFIGAEDVNVDPTLLYGGVAIGPIDSNPSAKKAGIPENIYTLTATYDFGSGFTANTSIINADSTYSGFGQTVELPGYTLVNAGIYYEYNSFAISVTGKNLTDETYFRSNFPDLFGSQIVLQELPRHFQASLDYKF